MENVMANEIKSKNIGALAKEFFKPGFISIPNTLGFFFEFPDDEKPENSKNKNAKNENVSEFYFEFPDEDKPDTTKGDKKKSVAQYIKGIAARFAIAAAIGTATFSSAATAHESSQFVPPKAQLVYNQGFQSVTSFEQTDIETCFESIHQTAKENNDLDDYQELVEEWGEMVAGRRYNPYLRSVGMTCYNK
jgi:hypothetical protein